MDQVKHPASYIFQISDMLLIFLNEHCFSELPLLKSEPWLACIPIHVTSGIIRLLLVQVSCYICIASKIMI